MEPGLETKAMSATGKSRDLGQRIWPENIIRDVQCDLRGCQPGSGRPREAGTRRTVSGWPAPGESRMLMADSKACSIQSGSIREETP